MLPPVPQLLADLVRRPSVNPMGRDDLSADVTLEHRVTDYLERCFKALGVPYRRQTVAPGRDNLVAEYRPPSPPFTALWECHQDTVPVDGMVVEPFGAKVEGGRLYGRGACDVKAGAAAMLAAFARLVREKPAGSAAVTLAFTVDEEHGFTGVRHLIMASGVRADCAVVAEPTGLNIVNAHKGVAQWVLETEGVACHSSRPDRGVNAIYRMARLVLAAEEYAGVLAARKPDPLLGPPTLSVGTIHGGASANVVPDRCRIAVDRRLVPGETQATAVAELEAFLRSHPSVDFPFSVAAPMAKCDPLDPTGSGELVGRLGAAINAVVGRHEVDAAPYGTDASAVAAAGVPAVVFGPGDIAQAHTKDEWVELAQVEAATDVLFRFACGK